MKEVSLIKLPGNGNLASNEAHGCNSSVATVKMQEMQPQLDWNAEYISSLKGYQFLSHSNDWNFQCCFVSQAYPH